VILFLHKCSKLAATWIEYRFNNQNILIPLSYDSICILKFLVLENLFKLKIINKDCVKKNYNLIVHVKNFSNIDNFLYYSKNFVIGINWSDFISQAWSKDTNIMRLRNHQEYRSLTLYWRTKSDWHEITLLVRQRV